MQVVRWLLVLVAEVLLIWPYATASPTAVHRRSRVQVGSDPGIHAHVEENDAQIFCHNETQPPIFTGKCFTGLPMAPSPAAEPIGKAGDLDTGGPGVYVVNSDGFSHGSVNGTMYFFYESGHDYVPYKYIILAPWASAFVTLCPTFEGRIVRGDITYLNGQRHLLGTWAEINWHPDGSSWGDISLLEGNDGAAIIQTLDGASNVRGFAVDLLPNAPAGAWAQKTDGSWCLDKITGPDRNLITRAWEAQYLDPWNVYLDDDINPVINSNNGRFQVTFLQGAI